jgi:hypothetical protein
MANVKMRVVPACSRTSWMTSSAFRTSPSVNLLEGGGAIVLMRSNSDENEQIEREEKDGGSLQEYLSR